MNKNFIPEKFLKVKAKKEEKSIKRGLIILLLGNLIILPVNINNIMESKKISKDNISLEDFKETEAFDLKREVVSWAEILEKHSDLGTIKDNSGEILIKNDKSLDKIKDKVSITKINNDERGYFIDVVGDGRWKSSI